jgi:formylglycine-generating enzyme required for sulfatase activity
MRKGNTHLITHFPAVLISVTAVLLTITPFSNPVSSATGPQSKGGAVAKPTPTPAPKKPRSSKSRVGSRESAPKTSADEIAFWETIKSSSDPEDFRAYLEQYPNGKFVSLARNRLNALETAAKNEAALKEEAARKEEAKRREDEAAKKRPGAVVKNSLGMELVYIPPGSFLMGSESGNKDEKPVRRVTLSKAFYIGKYEVAQSQWQTVMGENPSHFKDCGGNCPVEQISWDDAQDFIGKLNERDDGFTYRLPTEAEWEYACRAGTTGDYYGPNVDALGWHADSAEKDSTHPVGMKQPNSFGLFDMPGNVWEWCEDVYHDSYDGAPTDGSAWTAGGEQEKRVLRGGGWHFYRVAMRSAYRRGFPKNSRDYEHGGGVRVVAVPRF